MVVQKIAGVESVEVSLKQVMTRIRLKPGNAVTLAQISKIIKDGGFNSGAAEVDAVGTLVERNGAPVLLVTGTDASFRLMADANHRDVFRWVGEALKRPQDVVLVVGRVDAGEDVLVREARTQR